MGFWDLTSDFWAEIAEKTCRCNNIIKISGRFFVNDRETKVRAFCGRASVCDPTHRQVRAIGEMRGFFPFDFAQGQNAKQKKRERRWEL
jgi:hypothetical protein